jgi:hypothetical protein
MPVKQRQKLVDAYDERLSVAGQCRLLNLHRSVSNTMDASWVFDCLKATVQTHGTPGIINADQGSQFTGNEYIEYIKPLITVNISMDGKG